MNFAYLRVSTVEQHLDRQERMPDEIHIDEWFKDKATGRNEDRPALKAMMAKLRAGDCVYVHSLDRLGRRLVGIMSLADEFKRKGVVLHVLEPKMRLGAVDDDPINNAMASLFGLVAELEHGLILKRQKQAYEARKAKGLPIGRGLSPKIKKQMPFVIERLAKGESPMALSREYGIARSTIYRIRDNAIRDGKLPATVKAKGININ